MKIESVIKRLKGEEATLRTKGVTNISIFGSLTRGDNDDESDIDLACKIDMTSKMGLTEFYNIREYLEALLETKVDLIHEPVRFKPRLQAEIDKDRVVVF